MKMSKQIKKAAWAEISGKAAAQVAFLRITGSHDKKLSLYHIFSYLLLNAPLKASFFHPAGRNISSLAIRHFLNQLY
jgi:hypothetical protein